MDPLVQRLIRTGVRPNTITTVGTGLVLVSALAYGMGHIRLGGALLLLSGVADTLDGQVARGGAMVTRFGAFYDSTLDRVGDGATFIGIGAFLLTAPDVAYRVPAVITCMVAILSSLLVSYARARAEGLGLDCKVGSPSARSGSWGSGSPRFSWAPAPSAMVLEGLVALLAVASIDHGGPALRLRVSRRQRRGRRGGARRARAGPPTSSAPRRWITLAKGR